MTSVLRFVVFQLFLLWQGGFLFYSSFVVPAGTRLYGRVGQGAITARVTDVLNAVGVAGLVVLAIDLTWTRDPRPRRTACRWWAWTVALVSQAVLIHLHLLLDVFMDADRRRILIGPPFRPVHVAYLWASTVQWVACLFLAWWTLRAWRDEDRSFPVAPAVNGRGGEKN